MTLRLILTRHAKSDWSQAGQADFDRPLNHHGEDEARAIGDWLKSRGYLPDQILTSAATRTVATADIIAAALGTTPPRSTRQQLYQADADQLLAEVNHAEGRTVLLIAHNPGILQFAQDLLHDASAKARLQGYPTGATAVIDFTDDDWTAITTGRGALRDFITPDDLD